MAHITPPAPKEISPIRESLDKYGLTIDAIMRAISEGVQATDSKAFQYKGQVIESREKPSWDTRRAYLDMAAKLRALYPDERHHVTVEAVPVPDLPLSDDERAELEARKQIIKERLLRDKLTNP